MSEEEKRGLELVWEAIHKDPEELGGGLFDTEADEAVLFYPGKAVRRGLLAWQKNKVEHPAEVCGISISTNEDRWSIELGHDLDLSGVGADEVHLSLKLRGLRLLPDRVLAYCAVSRTEGRVLCIDRRERAVAWQVPAHETIPHHVAPDGAQILIASVPDGTLQVVDGRTGQVQASLDGSASEQPEGLVGPAGGVALDGDTLLSFDRAGETRWRLELLDGEAAAAADRVNLGADDCVIVEPGAVRRLWMSDGSEAWRSEGPRGAQLHVMAVGSVVAVQDLASGEAQLFMRETGQPVTHEPLRRMTHWAPVGDDLVGTTEDGGALRANPDTGEVPWEMTAEGVKLGSLARVGPWIIATGVGEEDTPVLVQLDAETGAEVARAPSPLPGEPPIEALTDELFALTNPIALFIFRAARP